MTVTYATRSPEGQPTTSISKALAVLELVATSDRGVVGVSDVALAMGVPKSTAHRLLSALGEHGFIERVGFKYRVGGRFFELTWAMQWCKYSELKTVAAPILEALFDQVSSTVHLGALDGSEVLYLEKITGPGGCRIPSRVGGRMPAHCTALGKAILAFSPPEVVRQLLDRPLLRTTAYSIAAPEMLVNELVAIRRTGQSTEREESRLGVSCLAAPILDRGQAVAAVSIATTGSGDSLLRHAAAVRAAAKQIGRDLHDYEA